eukprot:TRINITY_DN4811_c0_g1_i2.p2 TRINITY_DN4811_c0_g1~~TRINITY_DN4811_c0_g1_i2.p2  ORF type:complete len:129 (-),score=23.98 TRINITY_DN4811_c0_g1_i2:2260-2646(-)
MAGGLKVHYLPLRAVMLFHFMRLRAHAASCSSSSCLCVRTRRHCRWMAGGLKVYYLPLRAVMAGTALATFVAMYPLMRQIVIREGIDIVHGHQARTRAFRVDIIICMQRHVHQRLWQLVVVAAFLERS